MVLLSVFKKNNVTKFSTLVAVLFTFSAAAQSLSGNMNSDNLAVLGYGNVDIYKGEEKIMSILTDEMGNFNIKLDTGYYRLELKYSGHKTLIKNVRVTGDEIEDFNLSFDKGSSIPVYKEHVSTKSGGVDRVSEREESFYKEESFKTMDMKTVGYTSRGSSERTAPGVMPSSSFIKYEMGGTTKNIKPGQLTAGEINDFTKWDMWNDIVADELSKYQGFWNMSITERYTVQIKNENGFPIINAVVQLLDKNNEVYFESLTDNTGKAELWGKISPQDVWSNTAKAQILFDGESYMINRLTPFKQGINNLQITSECSKSNAVDIAFVVDATGSMGDEIEYLKAELNNVIYRTKNDLPELTFNFANVFYRDHGDEYLTRRQNFTDVLSTAVDFISQQRAAGGGDYEEAVEIALNEALDSLKWSENARSKILFLVLDAPPHNTEKIREQLKDIIRKASAKGVRIVPITASGIHKETEFLMRTLALGTNGSYLFLTNHSGIGNSHIEPSTDSYDVELLNDLLIRIIKTYTFLPDCNNSYNYDIIDIDDDSNQENNDSLIETALEWNAWPNPTKGELNILIKEDVSELFLTDLTGKILHRFTDIKKDRQLKTDISQYPKGIYLLSFKYKNKPYTKKIIHN